MSKAFIKAQHGLHADAFAPSLNDPIQVATALAARLAESANERDQASADPLVQHRYGQLWLLLRPAMPLAEAKCLAHRAGVEVSSQMSELTGARSTSAKYGFDRFWRNVRVHTLHDPLDYKYRDLGRFALEGTLPEPTAYS
jgi:alkylation response protein AidB-like acyl-CoA dehydrogenase